MGTEDGDNDFNKSFANRVRGTSGRPSARTTWYWWSRFGVETSFITPRSSRGRPRFAPPAHDPKPKPGRRNDADDVRLLVTEQELRAGAVSASDKTFSLWNVAT